MYIIEQSHTLYMICAAVHQWCEIKSHGDESKNLSAQKSNSNSLVNSFGDLGRRT